MMTELEELRERVSRLEKWAFKELTYVLDLHFRIVDLRSRGRDVLSIAPTLSKEGMVGVAEELTKEVKELHNSYGGRLPHLRHWLRGELRKVLGTIIHSCSISKVERKDVFVILIGELGKRLAKELVKIEDIMSAYGTEAAKEFSELVRKR